MSTIDELSERVKSLEIEISTILMSSSPWPLADVMDVLISAAEVAEESRDSHGHELITEAIKRGKQWRLGLAQRAEEFTCRGVAGDNDGPYTGKLCLCAGCRHHNGVCIDHESGSGCAACDGPVLASQCDMGISTPEVEA